MQWDRVAHKDNFVQNRILYVERIQKYKHHAFLDFKQYVWCHASDGDKHKRVIPTCGSIVSTANHQNY